MASRVVYMWSLSSLVGAFLDLAIAYFLLCASATAFIASKLLGLFGLCLPCPFDGLFVVNPNSSFCFQRLLIDYPVEKVFNVQLSVKEKFPFNGFVSEKEQNGNFSGGLLEERSKSNGNGLIEIMEDEASCSSVSDARNYHIDGDGGVKEGRFDVKGKEVMNQRPRRWVRRRRKGAVVYGRVSSVSSCDPSFGDVLGGELSPSSSINKGWNEVVEDRMVHLDNGADAHESYYVDDDQASRVIKLDQIDSTLFNDYNDRNVEEKNLLSYEVLQIKGPQESASSFGEKKTIELLEQALKEERASRAALYLELEKERSAAASAADEAMAMILRLQEEKASIEMEARQYQRMIEEKSAYDAEEMNLLKEILVRREREKLFLEKEVESYRQMIDLSREQFSDDVGNTVETFKQPLDSLLDPNEDPVLVLHQLSASIDKKALIKEKKKLQCSINLEQMFQEEETVSVDLYKPPQDGQRSETFPVPSLPGTSLENNFPENTIPIIGQEEKKEGSSFGRGVVEHGIETQDRTDIRIPKSDENLEQLKLEAVGELKNSRLLTSDLELPVHDIHVIVDESNRVTEDKTIQTNEISDGGNLPFQASARQSLEVIGDCPSSSALNAEIDIQRSSSDITSGLPPIAPSTKYLVSDIRRNSMSALENERIIIDHEVGRLRERLKIIQKGREKLNLSMEPIDREKMQLKILEDMSRQLQEIRHLSDSEKAVRQTSLPPPSMKAFPKKRRCRSVSSGVDKSS